MENRKKEKRRRKKKAKLEKNDGIRKSLLTDIEKFKMQNLTPKFLSLKDNFEL